MSRLEHIKIEFKSIYASIFDEYHQVKPLATKEPTLEELVSLTVRLPNELEKYLIPSCVDGLLLQIEARIQCAEFRVQIEEGVIQIRQERL